MGHKHSKNSRPKEESRQSSQPQPPKKPPTSEDAKSVSEKSEVNQGAVAMSIKSSRRKSDLKDAGKLVPRMEVEQAVERAVEEPAPAPIEVDMWVDKEVRLSRTKSALPSIKRAFSGLHLAPRSKSMPLPVPRRADIFLDEGTMSKIKQLQEDMMHNHSDESVGGHLHCAVNEVKLMKFLRSHCEYFTFGDQRLEGIPGEIRSMNGSLPNNIFVSCIKGLKSYADTTANQDNYSYCKLKDFEFFSVQDGHGTCGHIVSYRTVRTLPYYVIKSPNFPTDIEKAIRDGYEACQKDLVEDSIAGGFDLQISGCACTLAIRRGNNLWVSHTGDSRIVLGQLDAPTVVFETNDHKPTNPGEKLRLEQNGSEIHTFRFDNGHVEISRVFVKGKDYPGLCMSRSLGDQSVKECGVTAIPEIKSMKVESGKQFLVLASDGVWEFIPSKLVVSSLSKRIASEGGAKCVDRIITEAKKRWKQNEGTYCDDITAMLVLL